MWTLLDDLPVAKEGSSTPVTAFTGFGRAAAVGVAVGCGGLCGRAAAAGAARGSVLVSRACIVPVYPRPSLRWELSVPCVGMFLGIRFATHLPQQRFLKVFVARTYTFSSFR